MAIVVTGCGGFLGDAIVRRLIRRDETVIGMSRRRYLELEGLGMRWISVDLSRTDETLRAFAKMGEPLEGVIHTAAVAGIAGSREMYFQNNVIATRNVLTASDKHPASWFVLTSSPSVTFDGRDQSGVDESIGYSKRHLCHYSETKAVAEKEALQVDRWGMPVIALRPHLIYGPGDPHLVPRVIERARSGRLRIVGDGQNTIDVTHVDNAASAHLCAVDTLRDPKRAAQVNGRAYFITDDAPVRCWEWIGEQCEAAGVQPPRKRISAATAHRVGAVLETVWRWAPLRGDPPMTRFVAAQMSTDHYFDISQAKEDLGYQPRSPSELEPMSSHAVET